MTRALDPAERLARYGPTTGDRVRLADTDLWVRVTDDHQAPNDEPIWGYAKTLRPRMTQAGRASDSELDVVVAGALVIDPTIGIVKADIGIKDGRIVGVGRAGNPAISAGIELEIGPHTAPIMAYGLIATPGAVDSHVHLIEIDLVRDGRHSTAVPERALRRSVAAFDYHVCVHRADRPNEFFVYPIRLPQRLPTVSVPLLPNDPDVPLDLQSVFDRSYDTGPYRRRLDYHDAQFAPPLTAEQETWARSLLPLK